MAPVSIFPHVCCCALFLLLGEQQVIGQFDSEYSTVSPWVVERIGKDIPLARTIVEDAAGDLLVVASGSSKIIALYETTDEEGNRLSNSVEILSRPDLEFNHGMLVRDGFLYVSNPKGVYRWAYTSGQRSLITDPEEVVISGIPQRKKGLKDPHITRTFIFDSEGRLLVQVGAGDNIDQDSSRSRIRRFTLPEVIPEGGIDFETEGELYADGLRNTVGLGYDTEGRLWGVGNAGDLLERPDLGDNIASENPAEELNLLDGPLGTHYGYPYCWASYNISGIERNTPFAWPAFLNDGIHTDEWCRDPANNRQPVLALPAHEAPLSITFYDGRNSSCATVPGAIPCDEIGNAIVAFHGSYFKDIPGGFSVTLMSFNSTSGTPQGDMRDVIFEADRMKCRLSGIANCFRPVHAIVDSLGRIVFTTDYSGEIFRLYYNYTPPPITIVPLTH